MDSWDMACSWAKNLDSKFLALPLRPVDSALLLIEYRCWHILNIISEWFLATVASLRWRRNASSLAGLATNATGWRDLKDSEGFKDVERDFSKAQNTRRHETKGSASGRMGLGKEASTSRTSWCWKKWSLGVQVTSRMLLFLWRDWRYLTITVFYISSW